MSGCGNRHDDGGECNARSDQLLEAHLRQYEKERRHCDRSRSDRRQAHEKADDATDHQDHRRFWAERHPFLTFVAIALDVLAEADNGSYEEEQEARHLTTISV